MQSRYSAATESATATHTGGSTLRLKNRPNTGTSTTYSAVRKPALPLSVPATMPACWKFEAKASAVPQQKPPSQSCRRADFFSSREREGRSSFFSAAARTVTSTSSASVAI